MTKNDFLNKIYLKKRFGKRAGLEVMKDYSEALGFPEHGMRVIHIAGTNGKGSTAASLSSILRSCGFNVGLFTSPHLVNFNERIKYNGEDISDEDLLTVGKRIMEVETFKESTMFDDALAMALLYFRDKKCDYVILETGLGGRLDSTTGLDVVPRVSIITKIGLDHVKILGHSISDIAKEKAGIVKHGTTLVLAENMPEARNEIVRIADEMGVSVIYAADYDVSEINYSLRGKYQRENMENAVAAVNLLSEVDVEFWKDRKIFLKKAIENGLMSARWPGRMQVVSNAPFVLVDGAHNPQGVEALYESLRLTYPDDKFIGVCGVLADKDYTHMFGMMQSCLEKCYTVTVDNERSLSGEELQKVFEEIEIPAKAVGDTKTALSIAIDEAKRDKKKVVCFGSLYFVGEILKVLETKI
jgi:dihydrofolate synthase/folylpolyglutamate synthase